MAWLGRLSAGTPYLSSVALPMTLIGIGQGGVLGPLTAAGIAGVEPAASGVTNVAHQIGGSLGLAILVAIFAAADAPALAGADLLAHRISAALTGAAVLLALALVLAVAFIVRPHRGRHRRPAPEALARAAEPEARVPDVVVCVSHARSSSALESSTDRASETERDVARARVAVVSFVLADGWAIECVERSRPALATVSAWALDRRIARRGWTSRCRPSTPRLVSVQRIRGGTSRT
jgi:hypothetical protein